MSHQTKATHFSLFLHASLVLCALLFSRYAAQVRPPLVMDFSVLSAGLSTAPGPAAPAAAQPDTARTEKTAAQTVQEVKPKPIPPKRVAPPQRLAQPVKKSAAPPPEQAKEAAEAPILTQAQKPEPANPSPAAADAGAEKSAAATAATTAGAGRDQAGPATNQGGGGGTIFSTGQLDAPLTVLTQSPPLYPHSAKRRNIEGWIKVNFVVDEQGHVDQVKVLAAEPEGIFEQSVLQCINRWRFKPGTIGGRAVKALVEQTISFKLER